MDAIFYLIFLGLGSVLLSKGAFPFLHLLLKKVAQKTKSSLDDRMLEDAKGPLEAGLFIFFFFTGVYLLSGFDSSVIAAEEYLPAAVILFLTYFGFKAVRTFFHWYFEEGHSASVIKVDYTLIPLFQKSLQLVVLVIGFSSVLAELGLNMTGFVAFTSIVAILIGLASQESLANLFAGLALQFDRIYKYGDYLRLPSGEVVRLRKIGLRSTKFYDLSGRLMVVSNSEFAKMRVTLVESAKENADISVDFEAPVIVKPAFVENYLRKNSVGIKGLCSPEKITVHVTKVKGNSYEGKICLSVTDISFQDDATNSVNQLVLRKIGHYSKAA